MGPELFLSGLLLGGTSVFLVARGVVRQIREEYRGSIEHCRAHATALQDEVTRLQSDTKKLQAQCDTLRLVVTGTIEEEDAPV